MFKKIFLIFFFLALICFPFVAKSQESTDNTIVKSGYSTKCLEASTSDGEHYDGWCGGCPHSVDDPSTFNDTICVIDTGQATGSNQPIHQCNMALPPSSGVANFTLKNTPENRFVPGTQIIPVVKLGSGYSTTNEELDQSLGLGEGNSPIRLEFPDNPSGIFYADENGDVVITGIMRGSLDGHQDYQFYALYPPTILGAGGDGTDQITGSANSQQQGTIAFTKPMFEDANVKQTCTAIVWDPYGRVFDSQSLEPMNNIKIRILSEIKPSEKLAEVISGNPVTTKEDGIYNFLTKPGTYYLRLSDIPATHSFTENPKLNPKYSLIYQKSLNAQKSIYKPDEAIKEIIDTPEESSRNRPNPEERDIALDPGNNKPYSSPIIHMDLTEIVDGEDILLKGRASHPYPVLTIKDENGNIFLSKKEFLEGQARYGFWALRIKRSQLPQNAALIPILSKNPKIFSAQDDINIIDVNYPRFEPILAAVEGYAKDKSGQIIPNAKVQVKLYMNNRVFSETSADSTGFFRITSKNLPPFSYYFEFNGQVKKTSRFISDNQTYLKTNNLNLLEANNFSTIEEKTVNFSNMANYNPQSSKNVKNNIFKNNGEKNFLKKEFVLVLILVIFLIIVFLMLFFYIKKK